MSAPVARPGAARLKMILIVVLAVIAFPITLALLLASLNAGRR